MLGLPVMEMIINYYSQKANKSQQYFNVPVILLFYMQKQTRYTWSLQ